jgi:glycosyltransferase involved in cell wall biosynthesis
MVIYPYPMQFDGVSIQGEMLCKGLKKNGDSVAPCDRKADLEKKWIYNYFKPQVAIGIGYWGDYPDIIADPQRKGVQPVPWLNADGWVSNYIDKFNEMPLVLTTSEWVKETYIRDGCHGKNIYPMPIGIDTKKMSPLPKDDPKVQAIRKMCGIGEETKLIMTIGGDTTSKGSQEVLKALSFVDKEFKDWHYIGKSWYGPKYHRDDELKVIKDCGLDEKKITFIEGPSSREFTRAMLCASDIYAAPSRIEGFGMLQVEAQCCGKPVVSIDAMGVKDTVVHKKTGFLAKVGEEITLTEEWVYQHQGFPKKMQIKFDKPKVFAVRADEKELAEFILKLCTDEKLAEKMGKQALEHASTKFSHLNTSKNISDLIKKKLNIE